MKNSKKIEYEDSDSPLEDELEFSQDDEDLSENENAVLDIEDGEDSESDDYGSEVEDASNDEDDNDWGNKKSDYYSADENEEEEEKEAIRLQREKLKKMSEQNFIEENFDDVSDDADFELQSDEEKVQVNLENLSVEEKIQFVEKESPEIVGLIEELESSVKELNEELIPLIEKSKNNKALAKNQGMSFLQVKFQLLTSYCTNISFYLLLKANGKKVKDHPVIDRLVELRLYLEKMKPLESKLKYQIDKLLRLSKDETYESIDEENDPLKFRANLDNFMANESSNAEESLAYKVPKLAPVHYDPEVRVKSKDKKLELFKEKSSRARLLKDLRSEFSETPEEINADDSVAFDEDLSKIKEKLKYEEDNLMRFQLTKKDINTLKKQTRLNNEMYQLNDFIDDHKDSFEDSEDAAYLMNKKKKLLKHTRDILKREKLRNQADSVEIDQPKKKNKRRVSINESKNQVIAIESDKPVAYQEDEYYSEIQSAKKRKIEEREAQRQSNLSSMHFEEEELEADAKRPATYKILKNKGLTPKRKKEDRNPRVKRRMKYEAASKKLKSVKQVYQAPIASYGGEKTGIKSNLARSVKLK